MEIIAYDGSAISCAPYVGRAGNVQAIPSSFFEIISLRRVFGGIHTALEAVPTPSQ